MARRTYRQLQHPIGPIDPVLPAVQVLLGRGAASVVRRTLPARERRSLRSLRRRQVRYSPGRSIVVEYEITGVAGGSRSRSIVVLSSGLDAPGAAEVGVGEVTCRWWRYPDDPLLPGLAAVLHTERRRSLLEPAGVSGGDSPPRVRSYRATRRAVLEVGSGGDRVFARCVRPDRIDGLLARHDAAARVAVAAPVLAASTDEGVMVVGARPGRSLRSAARTGWDRIDELDDLLGAVAAVPPVGLPRVEPPARRLRRARRVLARIAPAGCEFLDRLASMDTSGRESCVVHGDLHTGQVLVDPASGALVGLVDLDTFGVGDEFTDKASLLAQLVVLADLDPRFAPLRDVLTEHWRRRLDPNRLAVRTAIQVVSLAVGPFRTQDPSWPAAVRRRLALAEAVIGAASDA